MKICLNGSRRNISQTQRIPPLLSGQPHFTCLISPECSNHPPFSSGWVTEPGVFKGSSWMPLQDPHPIHNHLLPPAGTPHSFLLPLPFRALSLPPLCEHAQDPSTSSILPPMELGDGHCLAWDSLPGSSENPPGSPCLEVTLPSCVVHSHLLGLMEATEQATGLMTCLGQWTTALGSEWGWHTEESAVIYTAVHPGPGSGLGARTWPVCLRLQQQQQPASSELATEQVNTALF